MFSLLAFKLKFLCHMKLGQQLESTSDEFLQIKDV